MLPKESEEFQEARRRIAKELIEKTGTLDLSIQCLKTIPDEIRELTSLTELNCASTQVSDLSPLAALTSLTELSALNCPIHTLPRSVLTDNPRLKLYVDHIQGVPAEVLSQAFNDDCHQRLLDHYQDIDAGAEQTTEVKVIVLGNGRIGKTQICNRLLGKEYVEKADSTHGVVVAQSKLAMAVAESPATLNLWDFGGQDIYHGTHSLFLKSRCVFMVVWTPSRENTDEYEYDGITFRNQPLEYWMQYVKSHGGDGCPVVLVQNQCETPQDEVSIPPVTKTVLDGFQCLAQIHYSAKTNRKREFLDAALRESIRQLRDSMQPTLIGLGRLRVRQRLQGVFEEDSARAPEQRAYRTLTKRQFNDICNQEGGVTSPDSLLDYLHNCGVVFYQPTLFNGDIILDQSWALDAIYTLFNRKQCYQVLRKDGRFTRSLLESLVWPSDKYSQADQERFISMMLTCGICFVHREGDEGRAIETEYIAPDMLPAKAGVAHQLAARWRDELPTASAAWRFDFLSHATIRSVMSKVGSKAGEVAVYWKYGVWFFDKRTGSEAIVEQLPSDADGAYAGVVSLTTKGGKCEELLGKVRAMIERDLERAGGKAEQVATATRPLSDDNTPAIVYADPPREGNAPDVWVSYGWKDEFGADCPHCGKVQQLCEAAEAKGFTIVRDIHALRPYDDLRGFMRMLAGGDLVFVILGPNYLKSPNCMYELLTIWHRAAMDWQEARDRIRVYLLPETKIHTIRDRLNWAGYWNSEVAGIEQSINAHGITALAESDLSAFKLMKAFGSNVGEMLAQISNQLQPKDFDQYIEIAITELENRSHRRSR